PGPTGHRYDYWRKMAEALEMKLPPTERLSFPHANSNRQILFHSGAARFVRVWPLVRVRNTVRRLRELGYEVQVACDINQRDWWLNSGEKEIATPKTISELLEVISHSAVFIGNDSGPGHLAA